MAGAGKRYILVVCGLIKLDASGNKTWDKTFSGSYNEIANSIVQTTDGGYAVAGHKGGDMWVIKLDASGNKTWDKTFGGRSYDRANAIVQTKDGGYAVAGYTSKGAGGYDMWVITLDKDGN